MKRDTTADRERTARIEDTADTITQSAQGVVPESAVIPDAQQVSTDIPTTTTTMDAYSTTVLHALTAQDAPETVTTGDVTTAQTPQEIQAAQMRATTVSSGCTSRSCTGQISEMLLHKLQVLNV